MKPLVIDGCIVSDENPCYVIAEIGHNHQGSVQIAKEVMRSAKDCGANAVKLQKRDNKTLYTRDFYNRLYDHENSFGTTYGEHREALEFGESQYRELQRYAKEIGITFFATAFDFASVDFLAALDMPAYKVASSDLTNTPLLRAIARLGKPMIVSTGASKLEDVRRAYDAVMPINPQLCFLQCTVGYPCNYDEMNLRVIQTYREAFPDVTVGLSAHDNGIAMSLVGYVLGARVIEKHFTLNRSMKGTDHAFSLEHSGLSKLVRDLKRSRVALGDGQKRVYENEKAPMSKMGKKLVAARDLPAGHVLSMADILIKSPNDGIPPYEIENVVGRELAASVREDEGFRWDILRESVRVPKREEAHV